MEEEPGAGEMLSQLWEMEEAPGAGEMLSQWREMEKSPATNCGSAKIREANRKLLRKQTRK
jgi:hypothetical protein